MSLHFVFLFLKRLNICSRDNKTQEKTLMDYLYLKIVVNVKLDVNW